MDIKQFEEMIIDYLDGNLSGAEKKYFEEALNSSDEYRGIFEQYKSIRTVTGPENDLEPPAEVIERISEQVKKSIKKEKKSVFERWFKFPILAPVFAVAIIATLWISAGEDYLKNKNIIPESERSASNEFRSDYKASAGKLNQNVATSEEELQDKEVDKVQAAGKRERNDRVAASVPAPSVVVKKKQEYTVQPTENDSMGDFASAPLRQETEFKDLQKGVKSDDLLTEENEEFANLKETSRDNVKEEKQGYESQVAVLDKGALKSETVKSSETIGSSYSRNSTTTSSISPSKRVEITNDYRNELNEIVTMQYRGDCEQSLKRSQELLDADPEPSISIKTDLYLTQGECFMELKQYDNALAVYEKAKELTPHKSHLFNGKIKEVYIRQQK